jgi:hypothetical protein
VHPPDPRATVLPPAHRPKDPCPCLICSGRPSGRPDAVGDAAAPVEYDARQGGAERVTVTRDPPLAGCRCRSPPAAPAKRIARATTFRPSPLPGNPTGIPAAKGAGCEAARDLDHRIFLSWLALDDRARKTGVDCAYVLKPGT